MRSGPSTSRWGTLLTLPVWERGPLTAKARGYRSVASARDQRKWHSGPTSGRARRAQKAPILAKKTRANPACG